MARHSKWSNYSELMEMRERMMLNVMLISRDTFLFHQGTRPAGDSGGPLDSHKLLSHPRPLKFPQFVFETRAILCQHVALAERIQISTNGRKFRLFILIWAGETFSLNFLSFNERESFCHFHVKNKILQTSLSALILLRVVICPNSLKRFLLTFVSPLS